MIKLKNHWYFLIILFIICILPGCLGKLSFYFTSQTISIEQVGQTDQKPESKNVNISAKTEKIKQPEYKLLTVSFLDVGQADSIFIELPEEKTILIDAGNADSGQEVLRYINNKGYDRIHYLIATHPHADHIGGMEYIINNINIDYIYAKNFAYNSNI